jgi:hypothetical protein
MNSARARDDLRLVVVGAEAVLLEARRDLAAVLVDDRPHDVARVVVVDLDDEFAEVGLEASMPCFLRETARARSPR